MNFKVFCFHLLFWPHFILHVSLHLFTPNLEVTISSDGYFYKYKLCTSLFSFSHLWLSGYRYCLESYQMVKTLFNTQKCLFTHTLVCTHSHTHKHTHTVRILFKNFNKQHALIVSKLHNFKIFKIAQFQDLTRITYTDLIH